MVATVAFFGYKGRRAASLVNSIRCLQGSAREVVIDLSMAVYSNGSLQGISFSKAIDSRATRGPKEREACGYDATLGHRKDVTDI